MLVNGLPRCIQSAIGSSVIIPLYPAKPNDWLLPHHDDLPCFRG